MARSQAGEAGQVKKTKPERQTIITKHNRQEITLLTNIFYCFLLFCFFFSLIETLHDHILAKLITLLDQKNLLTPHGSPDFGSRKIITILIFLYPLQDQTVTRDYWPDAAKDQMPSFEITRSLADRPEQRHPDFTTPTCQSGSNSGTWPLTGFHLAGSTGHKRSSMDHVPSLRSSRSASFVVRWPCRQWQQAVKWVGPDRSTRLSSCCCFCRRHWCLGGWCGMGCGMPKVGGIEVLVVAVKRWYGWQLGAELSRNWQPTRTPVAHTRTLSCTSTIGSRRCLIGTSVATTIT